MDEHAAQVAPEALGQSNLDAPFSEECPDCGARSAEARYVGHAMGCRAYWRSEARDA